MKSLFKNHCDRCGIRMSVWRILKSLDLYFIKGSPLLCENCIKELKIIILDFIKK